MAMDRNSFRDYGLADFSIGETYKVFQRSILIVCCRASHTCVPVEVEDDVCVCVCVHL